MDLSAATRVFAVLGDPVAHSRSPEIQNAAFRAAGVDGVYVALRVDGSHVHGLLRGLALAGGGGNVTLPHKAAALRAADRSLPAARHTGVANTFWMEDGQVVADNTDVEGFRRATEISLDGGARDRDVLVLGAGGAARAVVVALLASGAARVSILNRTPRRARELADALRDPRIRVLADDGELVGAHRDLVVNATRLGLEPGDPLPVDLGRFADVGAVLDVVYGPGAEGTRFVREARSRGIPADDGREMLLQQGAAAFERWWQRDAPLDAMRAALAEATHR